VKHPTYDFRRRTKIVCTIGPASGSPAMVERMIRSGMNVARLNLTHGSFAEHAAYVEIIRRTSDKLGFPVAILMDIPGPKYRTGDMKLGQATLKKGATFVLTVRKVEGDAKEVSVNLPNLTKDVKAHDLVLVDDGAIQLRATEVSATDVRCKVLVGGVLKSRKGITVPGMKRSVPFLTGDSMSAIQFAAAQHPDFIGVSFVTGADDLSQVREFLTGARVNIPLISKIETRQAIAEFDHILAASDGIMVARGDMGVELPLPKVPLIQKEIIRKCNEAGKPVITATQMLESMILAPRPTRAEVADVANAIFDGTDAIMLSAETSVGRYPVQALRMMVQIARETDGALPYSRMLHDKDDVRRPETDDAISFDACHTAFQLGAKAIVAFTTSGSTALRVSRYRPKAPVLAITPVPVVRRRLALTWGSYPFEVDPQKTVDDVFERAAELARDIGIAKKGDLVVVTAGIPLGIPGTTNLLKVVQV
jgi:pyruvate kinase